MRTVENQRNFYPFFWSRALSTFGDEIWAIGLPIYFAMSGYSVVEVGVYSSSWACGTIFGFYVLPKILVGRFPSKIAIAVDVVQLAVFLAIAVMLSQIPAPNFQIWIALSFVLAAATAIWFGSSESLIANTVSSHESQGVHRLNYLSSSIGPCIAPLCASAALSFFGIASVALFNAGSFLYQITALRRFKIIDRRIPVNERGHLSLYSILNDNVYRPMLFLTWVVKVGLLGVLSFIPFIITRSGAPFWQISALTAAFPAGTIIGAWSKRDGEVGVRLLTDCVLMFTAGAVLIISLQLSQTILIASSALAAGIFSAKYTIAIRTMRQIITPAEHMPRLVSLQGLASRLVTPLSGILFAAVFASTTIWIAGGVSVVLSVAGITSALFVSRSFADFSAHQTGIRHARINRSESEIPEKEF